MDTGKKKRSLQALYQSMETEEIERRLAGQDLADLAREVATAELVVRRTAPAPDLAPLGADKADDTDGQGATLAALVAGTLLFSAMIWAVLPRGTATLLIIAVSLPTLATVIGKAAPVPAQIFGWLFLATPLWLGAILWHRGDLAWKAGDFRPLESLIAWIVLGFLSMVGMAIGSALIAGAQHGGRWAKLAQALEERKRRALGSAKRLD